MWKKKIYVISKCIKFMLKAPVKNKSAINIIDFENKWSKYYSKNAVAKKIKFLSEIEKLIFKLRRTEISSF